MALDHTPEARPSLPTLEQRGDFIRRHIGPDPRQIGDMLVTLGLATRDRYKRATPGRIIGVSRDRPRPAGPAHGATDARATAQRRPHSLSPPRGHRGLDHLKELALVRLALPRSTSTIRALLTNGLRLGRLVIVNLRDELIEKDEALGLFVVFLQMFAEATYEGRRFNKLVVFDEAHKYIDNPDLIAGLREVVREMRHTGTSILVVPQDPPSVPASLIERSSQTILHKFNSPSWLKHIRKANAALDGWLLRRFGPGESYVWSSRRRTTPSRAMQ